MTSPGGVQAQAAEPREPEAIERDIEDTRQQLGDTVEALAEKTDVTAQARRRLDDAKAAVSDKRQELVGAAERVSPDGVSSAASRASAKARANPQALTALAAFAAGYAASRLIGRE